MGIDREDRRSYDTLPHRGLFADVAKSMDCSPMLIGLPDLPLTYANMPKAGCTSVKNFIYFLEHRTYPEDPLSVHARFPEFRAHFRNDKTLILARLHTDTFFTFVRHPLRRAYSLFSDKIVHTGPYSFPRVRQLLRRRYGVDLESEQHMNRCRANFMAFLQFVADTFEARVDFRIDPHWAPQTKVLGQIEKIRHLDFVGRTEKLNDDMGFILRRAGFDGYSGLPHFNESTPLFKYEDMITPELKELGYQIYRNDFDQLGYSV